MLDRNEEIAVDTDDELVARAREGCREAFGELVSRHYQCCVKIASLILQDRAEAQDEVQEACYKALKHLDQYQGRAEFSTWMVQIVRNQCLTLLRFRRRVRSLHIDDDHEQNRGPLVELPSSNAGPEEEVIGREVKDVLEREIRKIPPLLRSVLVLRDVQELPMTDVAERLNITVPAAKSRLFRARVHLKERMMHQCGNGRMPKPHRQRKHGNETCTPNQPAREDLPHPAC